jgi:uncharacterized protein DUF1707
MEVWSSFTRDPRDRQHQVLRASDQDRLLVQQVLVDAYADGRLDREEFDERSEAARTVRTLGDIDPLLKDLVAPPAAPDSLAGASRSDLERLAHRHWQHKRREAAFSFAGFAAVIGTVCVVTDMYWPAFFLVFSLLHLLRTVTSRQEIVDQEVRRLEKRQAKELRSRPGRGPGWGPLDWKW